MKQLLASNVSLVLECRDYRIPLTSQNPLLDEALKGRRRVVVYTKHDLGVDLDGGGARERGGRGGRVERALRAWGTGGEGAGGGAVLTSAGRGEHLDADGRQRRSREAEAEADQHKDTTFFFTATGTGVQRRTNAPALLQLIKQHARAHFNLTGTRVLVAGMPNVGKSTLLNALRNAGGGFGAGAGAGRVRRKGKVATTGGMPGVTRSVGSAVKILEGWEVDGLSSPPVPSPAPSSSSSSSPPSTTRPGRRPTKPTPTTPPPKTTTAAQSEPVYIHDTPGVFMPYVPSGLAMLKLALCGCVKDGLVPPVTVADYLLYELNLRDPGAYLRLLRPRVGSTTTSTPGSKPRSGSQATSRTPFPTVDPNGPDIPNTSVPQTSPQTQPQEQPQPTNSITHLLTLLAKRLGKLSKGGGVDLEATAVWFVQQWRRGEVGRFVLDDGGVLAASVSERTGTSFSEPRQSVGEVRRGDGEPVRRSGDRGGEETPEPRFHDVNEPAYNRQNPARGAVGVSVSQARKAERERRRERGRVVRKRRGEL